MEQNIISNTVLDTTLTKISILNFMNAIIMLDMLSQQWEYLASSDARSLNAYFKAHKSTFTEDNTPLGWNYCCEYNRTTQRNYAFLEDAIQGTDKALGHKCQYCLLAGYAWKNEAEGCLRMSSKMHAWKYTSTKGKRNKYAREIIQACAKVHVDLMKGMLENSLYSVYTSDDFRSTSGISESMFSLVDEQINKYNTFLSECYL